jgi:hypothetical protein
MWLDLPLRRTPIYDRCVNEGPEVPTPKSTRTWNRRWILVAACVALVVVASTLVAQAATHRATTALPTQRSNVAPPSFTPFQWPAVGTALPDGKLAGDIQFATPTSAPTASANSASLTPLLASLAASDGVDPSAFGVRYALFTDVVAADRPAYVISLGGQCAFYGSLPAGVSQPTGCEPAATYYVVDAKTGQMLKVIHASAPPGYYDEGGIVLQVPTG